MTEIMMIYSIPKSDKNIRSQFTRRLYAQKVKSHKGEYIHITKGILQKFRKPTNACIIFNKNRLTDVKKLSKKYAIITEFYQIQKIR